MTNIDPERAEILPLIEGIDTANFPYDMPTPPEFVVAAGDESQYVSVGLGHARMFIGGSPRHWYFVAPAKYHAAGLVQAEFGITHHDFTGQDPREARFDHEMSIDTDMRLNAVDAAKREMFGLVGGMVVPKVRDSGDLFFAGLEIRYRQTGENEAVRWTQLVYSKALLDTQSIFNEALERGISLPPWARDAADPEKREIVAENLALSALMAARKLG